MTTQTLIPVEALKPGMGITVTDTGWGKNTYLIHDIEEMYHGEEFRITFGTDNGRWTDTTSFVAGDLVEAA